MTPQKKAPSAPAAAKAVCDNLADSISGMTIQDVKALLADRKVEYPALALVKRLAKEKVIQITGSSRANEKGRREEVYVLSPKGWMAYPRHSRNPHQGDYRP